MLLNGHGSFLLCSRNHTGHAKATGKHVFNYIFFTAKSYPIKISSLIKLDVNLRIKLRNIASTGLRNEAEHS